ncbi:hypothetical protein [Devosia sp.]
MVKPDVGKHPAGEPVVERFSPGRKLERIHWGWKPIRRVTPNT